MAKAQRAASATETTTEATEAKVEKVNQVLANEDMKKVAEEYKTKSAMIRYFTSKEYTRSDIAKAMGIRYQHVRNVQVADLAKAEA